MPVAGVGDRSSDTPTAKRTFIGDSTARLKTTVPRPPKDVPGTS